METPFNTTAFTEDFKQDVQARYLSDVYKYAVSVQTPQSTSVSQNDIVNMRGFRSSSAAATVNGLGGLLTRVPSVEPFERFEMLLGANAFANGQTGNVGGLMNLVTKRAGAEPLTRVTTGYESDSVKGGKIDLARRFGDTQEWGVRFNGAYSSGNTAVEATPRKIGVASIGLDYRGQRLRASFDAMYSRRDQRQLDYLLLGANVPVPSRVPEADKLFNLRGTRYEQEFHLAMARVEYDLAPNWTLSAAHGVSRWNDHILRNYPTLTDAAGTLAGKSADYRASGTNASSEVVLRGSMATGNMRHALAAGMSRVYQESRSLYAPEVNAPLYNLYAPPNRALPSLQYSYIPPYKGNDSTTRGAFVSDQIGLLDERLLLLVGVRKVEIASGSYNVLSGAAIPGGAYRSDALTPGYGIVYRFTPQLSVYANRVKALENGLVVGSSYANAGAVLSPLQSKQTEVGVKTEIGGFALTAALFEIQKANQYADSVTNVYVQNGLQRNRGIELSAFGELTRGVRLYSGLSEIDAKVVRSAGGTLDGKKTLGIPGYTFTTHVDADIPGVPGAALMAGVIRNGKTQFDATNTRQVPGWTRVDLGARYKTRMAGKDVAFRLSIENALNKNFFVQDSTLLLVAPPRTVLLSAALDF